MSKGRFLIVEDEFAVAESLRSEIESMDYAAVGIASSGMEAVELAGREKPDLVLMDIKLVAGMDGIETAIQLRLKWDIPVLFLTAFSDESILERARLAEPLGYLVKPYDHHELRASIRIAHYKARMERLLKESESRFRSIFENSPVAYMALDAFSRILDLNAGLCALLGYDREELVGRNFIDLCPPETQLFFPAESTELKVHGTLQTERRLVRKDNSQLTVLLEGRIQTGMDNEFLRMHCILHNITERQRVEEDRLQLSQQLQQIQKAESLGRMAGAIAHSFNNHLQVVMGNLEMAMGDLQSGAISSASLALAMQAARKAAKISRRMLTYLGQPSGKHKPIDFSEACRQSLPLLQAAAPKGVTIKVDFPSCGPVVHGNTKQIHQILDNLVTNAWESISDNHGSICLAVKTVSRAEIPVSKRFPIDWQPQASVYACLEVSDSGNGIVNRDFEKIFDPFFTTKSTGRGLGLSVVMGIAKAHGGAITVDSELGHGSVFRVFLASSTEESPCRYDLPAMPGAPETVKAGKPSCIDGGVTVLLIEDEEQVRELAKIMLTHLGYTVIEAKDGSEAEEIFRKHPDKIRCVLSDLSMPRMNGWETLAALRRLSPDIPVIISSGYDEAHVMAGEHAEQPNAFIGKPYQLKKLRETIHRVLTVPAHDN